MMLSLIAAVDSRLAIGLDNRLLFWLPNDLKRFKALTTGHTILMGRKTFDSLPKGALPNRRNLVLSRQLGWSAPHVECYTSLSEALDHCVDDEKLFVIGGESLYRQALPVADELCLTEVDAEASQADAYFPRWTPEEWEEVSRECYPSDEKHPYAYAFATYRRRKKK